MISEADRYQGAALRQIILGARRGVNIAVSDASGRVDCFLLDGHAIQIKYSSKRLSPWQFTYAPEQRIEVQTLCREHGHAWTILVCGIDGIVTLGFEELLALIGEDASAATTIRVSRKRNAMYRVSGTTGKLEYAKRRGPDELFEAMSASTQSEAGGISGD